MPPRPLSSPRNGVFCNNTSWGTLLLLAALYCHLPNICCATPRAGYISLQYDSVPNSYLYKTANFGPVLGGGDSFATAQANLFTMNPNVHSAEATLCTLPTKQKQQQRRISFRTKDNRNQQPSAANGTFAIALLLPQGPCTADVQVRNAMQINGLYGDSSSPTSRHITFVFIFETQNSKYPLTQTTLSATELRSFNIYTFFLDALDGLHIWGKMQESHHVEDSNETDAHYTLLLESSVFNMDNNSTFSPSYLPIWINQPPYYADWHHHRFFTNHFQWVRLLVVFLLGLIVLIITITFIRSRIRRRRTLNRLLEENPPMNFDIRRRTYTQVSVQHRSREQVLNYLPQLIYGSLFTEKTCEYYPEKDGPYSLARQQSNQSNSSSHVSHTRNNKQGVFNLDDAFSPPPQDLDVVQSTVECHPLTSESMTSIHLNKNATRNSLLIPIDDMNNEQRDRTFTSESISSIHSATQGTVSEAKYNHTETGSIHIEDLEGTHNAPSSIQLVALCCTGCSICIDDFILGEKVRMLPRCGHIFHLECVVPWLTEREDTCPLCKTPVFDPLNI